MSIIKKLSEKDVHDECDNIQSMGEKPTALALFARLNRGSLSTITKYLNSWEG